MLDLPDPITGIIGLFFKRALESKIGRRLELLLEMAIASSIVFLITSGASLASHVSVPVSLGCGMLAAGLAMLATFQASSNSKGLTIAVQRDIQEQKDEEHFKTISK